MSPLRVACLLTLAMAMVSCAMSFGTPADLPSNSRGAASQVLVMLHLPPAHFRPDANYAGGYGDDLGHSARRRIAADLARAHGLKLVADWPMPVLNVDCFVMEQPANVSAEPMVNLLSRDPRVDWAQPLHSFHALALHDPLYPLQPSAMLWHLADIHQVATGRKVRVAIVDSGIEAEHPDLEGQVEIKENFVDGDPYVPETHGTAVAGVIAAHAGNGVGIEGVAPGARLLALRACWEESVDVTECNSFTVGKALNAAIAHRAEVINLSFAGPSDRLLQRLLETALTRGIKVIAAVDPHAPHSFPASHPGVFAITDDAAKAAGANGIGARILLAPGRDIPTTIPGARWGFVSGSSFAAAHVSGLMALLSEMRPGLEPSEIRTKLVLGPADPQAAATVDACATIAQTAGTCTCSCTTTHAAHASQPP